MKIFGIDPGTATTGWGLIKVNGEQCTVDSWGLIETDKETKTEDRLNKIFEGTLSILKKLKPEVFVFEKIFFANNAKTAMAVSQAQGVMLLAAAWSKLPVVGYAPGTIKKVITGDGRATKADVQKSIRKILGAKVRSGARKRTHFDNSADALAIALCHAKKEGEKNEGR